MGKVQSKDCIFEHFGLLEKNSKQRDVAGANLFEADYTLPHLVSTVLT